MPETVRRLISPEYLAVPHPGPVGGIWPFYACLAICFSILLAVSVRDILSPSRHQYAPGRRGWAWLELGVCFVGLVAVTARLADWPAFSQRSWTLLLASLAALGILAFLLRDTKLSPAVAEQLSILAISPLANLRQIAHTPVRAAAWFLLGLFVHATGLAVVVAGRYSLPPWLAFIALGLIVLPQIPLLVRRQRPRFMPLAPMFAAYGAVLIWHFYRSQGITVVGWQGLEFPEPFLSAFHVDGIILAAVVLSQLCQLNLTALRLNRRKLLWRWSFIALVGSVLVWATIVYLGNRTHGATASDPYAYAQMAVDLAERGTFLHRFPLFERVTRLDLNWPPLLPIGYHKPISAVGDSASVWPTGASVFLAAGYLLMGEPGLYFVTPILALLALCATWALANEVLTAEPKPIRYITAALTVALLATSPERLDRLLVPMADAPATLFTVLALFFALRAMHQLEKPARSATGSLVLAGVSLGLAYWVRHTQLLLGLPLVLAILIGSRNRSHRSSVIARSLLLLFAPAIIVTIPDIAFRWAAFGGPLATETSELPSMGLEHMGTAAAQAVRAAIAAGEWGYLLPVGLYGAYRLIRCHSREATVLFTAFAIVLLLHLTYRFLRLRDLLSLFPLLNLAVAYGAVSLVRFARSLTSQPKRLVTLGPSMLATVLVAWVVLCLAMARWTMLPNLWQPVEASFGYMRQDQRLAFDRLAALTPDEAIIATSLNAGAVMLYTGRDAIRPYDGWTPHQWETFLTAMRQAQRPVYLLDDGPLMREFVESQRTPRRATKVEALGVPIFDDLQRDSAWLYRMERDQ